MTPSQRAELARLLAEASDGPWETSEWLETDGECWAAIGPRHATDPDECGDIIPEPGDMAHLIAQRDARLIAAMHAALPQLLADSEELERVKVKLAAAETEMADERNWYESSGALINTGCHCRILDGAK